MDALLESRDQEAVKLRVDYDALYEQFKLTNDLFAEREALYKKQLADLENSLEILQRKNENLKFALKTQTAAKEAFIQDVHQLQELAKLMEQRENALLAANQDVEARNQQLRREMDSVIAQKEHAESESQRLIETIQQMVHRSEHHAVLQQLKSLDQTLQQDYVSRVLYQQLQEDFKKLQRHVEADTVERSLYEHLNQRHHQLEQHLQEDYVAREEYQRLQTLLDGLLGEKSLWEESQRVLTSHDVQHQAQLEEAEAKVVSLKGRVEQSEMELSSLRRQVESLQEENIHQKGLISSLEHDLSVARDRVFTAETQMHTLHTQLGQLKLLHRQEVEAKQEAIEGRRRAELNIEQLKKDTSSVLLESTQQLQRVFEVTESQYQEQIQHLTAQITQLTQSLAEKDLRIKQQEQTENDLRQSSSSYQSSLSHLTQELESLRHLNQELQRQQSQVIEENLRVTEDYRAAQNQMEELRVMVLQELSPSSIRNNALRRSASAASVSGDRRSAEEGEGGEEERLVTSLSSPISNAAPPRPPPHLTSSSSSSLSPLSQHGVTTETGGLSELMQMYASPAPAQSTPSTRRGDTPPPRHLWARHTASSAAKEKEKDRDRDTRVIKSASRPASPPPAVSPSSSHLRTSSSVSVYHLSRSLQASRTSPTRSGHGKQTDSLSISTSTDYSRYENTNDEYRSVSHTNGSSRSTDAAMDAGVSLERPPTPRRTSRPPSPSLSGQRGGRDRQIGATIREREVFSPSAAMGEGHLLVQRLYAESSP